MSKIFEILLSPITVIFMALAGFFSVIIGAVSNPGGFLNTLICGIIDMIAFIFPSTPEQFRIVFILDSVASSMPLVGKRIVYDIAATFAIMAGLVLVVKIYRLIPFKMS